MKSILIIYITVGLLLTIYVFSKATSDPIWKRLKAGLLLIVFWGPYLLKPFMKGFVAAVRKERP